MYEATMYEEILKRMLNRIPNDMDKREGSIIYDALAPAAVELQLMYIELDAVLRELFADTAGREYLIKRAEERGLSPKPASHAVLKGEFNMDIPIGSRFSLETLNYTAIERIAQGQYRMQCETIGAAGNRLFGTIIPIEYISGLTRAELKELLIPGADEEETEHFRNRYFDSLHSQAFGGNVADYREKVNAMPGVGGVKVFPIWNGGGTVKLVLLNSEYRAPTEELLSQVKEAIDPEGQEGEGYGLAPIGHTVTVEAAKEETIQIETCLSYQPGWDYETCQEGIEAALDAYYDELRRGWESKTTTVVRVSQIESRLLDVEGLLDIADTRLNGRDGNLELPENCIPVRGTING